MVRGLVNTTFNRLFFIESRREVTLVPVLRGAMHLASDYLRMFNINHQDRMLVHVEPIEVRRYFHDEDIDIELVLDIQHPEHIRNRNVVVLDDIIGTGASLHYIGDHLKKMGAATLSADVLIQMLREDKNKKFWPLDPSRRAELNTLYSHEIKVGFMAREATYVGYGMDFEGYFRDRSDICVLSDEQVKAFREKEHERELSYRTRELDATPPEKVAAQERIIQKYEDVKKRIDDVAESIYLEYKGRRLHCVVEKDEPFGMKLVESLLEIYRRSEVKVEFNIGRTPQVPDPQTPVLLISADATAETLRDQLKRQQRDVKMVSLIRKPEQQSDWSCFTYEGQGQIAGFGIGNDKYRNRDHLLELKKIE